MNTCYNCIDRHLSTQGNKVGLIYESPVTKSSKTFTWNEMYEQISKLAGVLKNHNVQKGDRVIIFMPMIPEAIFAQLACARIGAVHSVVFGGFAAKELASRIIDANPKVIISASCGIEPDKVINYNEIIDNALKITKTIDLHKIIIQRPQLKVLLKEYDFDYNAEMAKAKPIDCLPVQGNDYLYILYTSGTTGQPKGIVRENGGNAVALSWAMKYIMGIEKGDVYFSGSDIGWVVGHSYTTYGPLLAGATTIIFEGKPVGTPDAGIIWKIIEKHKVNGLYTSPTALRSIRKEDPDGKFLKMATLTSLKTISMAGERCDIHTFKWIQDLIPKNCLLNDCYWQTETGWHISCNYKNLYTFNSKPGSATKPCPGYQIDIFDENDHIILQPRKIGKICIKLPLPPSFMATLYNNDESFVNKYFKDIPGYYASGDAGYIDEDGYLSIIARIDDIINTAGHRLSTFQMEEVLMSHPDVTEAAVVGADDQIKGEIPIGFVVLKFGSNSNLEAIERELIKKVREDIGPIASFKYCIVVEKLPKTRSGKILRKILKKMIAGIPFTIPPTIEDESVLLPIQIKIKQKDFGKSTLLTFTN